MDTSCKPSKFHGCAKKNKMGKGPGDIRTHLSPDQSK